MKSYSFKINEFLSLELWGDKTFIYVNNKKFRQCKYILLKIPIENIEQYNSINSINEIIEIEDRSLETSPELLPPEVEFWAHCSNLQAWAENDYNTDLLDSVLSFPLLKKLTLEGDRKAKKVFKEEIGKRLTRGDLRTVHYLVNERYLEFLSGEELNSIVTSEDFLLFENIFDAFKSGDMDQYSAADSIYTSIGKYLYPSIEKKLWEIFKTENIEEILVIFSHMLLDELSDEKLLLLCSPPMNLLEKTFRFLNKVNFKEIDIDIIIERGLFSKKLEHILGNRIKENLLKIIYERNIKYEMLITFNLLKYIKDENVNYLKELK